jgi:hypothetical protein
LNNYSYTPKIVSGKDYNELSPVLTRSCNKYSVVKDAGWHFSYLMGSSGVSSIRNKLLSYSDYNQKHTLPILEAIQHRVPVNMAKLTRQIDRKSGYCFNKVKIDESFPSYVTSNLGYFIDNGYIL